MNLKRRIPEKTEAMDATKEVKNFFITHKQMFNKGFDLYEIVAVDILRNFTLKKGKVLDIGCGYGGLIKRLNSLRKNLHFTGIDISKNMLKLAKNYMKKDLKFLFMSAEKLNFDKETFDLIICKETLHHFSKPTRALKEMLRVLKKDGVIYITDLRRDSPKKAINRIIKETSLINPINAIQYIDSLKASYTLLEIKKLLKRAKIKRYKLYIPKVDKNLMKKYKKLDKYFSAVNYYSCKWALVIPKQ